MPAGMDEWTHFSYGPDGNAVSQDTAIRIPNALRLADPERLATIGPEVADEVKATIQILMDVM